MEHDAWSYNTACACKSISSKDNWWTINKARRTDLTAHSNMIKSLFEDRIKFSPQCSLTQSHVCLQINNRRRPVVKIKGIRRLPATGLKSRLDVKTTSMIDTRPIQNSNSKSIYLSLARHELYKVIYGEYKFVQYKHYKHVHSVAKYCYSFELKGKVSKMFNPSLTFCYWIWWMLQRDSALYLPSG